MTLKGPCSLAQKKETFIKQYSIRNLLSSIKVSDEELSQYYNNNKNAFIDPEKVRASHILVSDEEKANEIISEIKEGLSFEDAAKKYSSCPSNAVGGDLGFFERGKMVPEFEDAAFALEINELSKPVKTQFGYHIIIVKEKIEEKNKSFEEVKDIIYQQLIMQKQNEIYINKSNELRKKYTIKIME